MCYLQLKFHISSFLQSMKSIYFENSKWKQKTSAWGERGLYISKVSRLREHCVLSSLNHNVKCKSLHGQSYLSHDTHYLSSSKTCKGKINKRKKTGFNTGDNTSMNATVNYQWAVGVRPLLWWICITLMWTERLAAAGLLGGCCLQKEHTDGCCDWIQLRCLKDPELHGNEVLPPGT